MMMKAVACLWLLLCYALMANTAAAHLKGAVDAHKHDGPIGAQELSHNAELSALTDDLPPPSGEWAGPVPSLASTPSPTIDDDFEGIQPTAEFRRRWLQAGSPGFPTVAPVSSQVSPTAAPVSAQVVPTASPVTAQVVPTASPVTSQVVPTASPVIAQIVPTRVPTGAPFVEKPTAFPNAQVVPTAAPAVIQETRNPTASPVAAQVVPTRVPTAAPFAVQVVPTASPVAAQVVPTAAPFVGKPTAFPIFVEVVPTASPMIAQVVPTRVPTAAPFAVQVVPTQAPTRAPIFVEVFPTPAPVSAQVVPTRVPTGAPFVEKVTPTASPVSAQVVPTRVPTGAPFFVEVFPTPSPTTCGETGVTVRISGNVERSSYYSSSLLLSSTVSVLPCSGFTNATVWTYNWQIRTTRNETLLRLSSTSKDPSKLQLAAFSLKIGTTYTFAVTITNLQRSFYSSVVRVDVLATPLVAVVSPSSIQMVRVGSRLLLDARGSYDPDDSNNKKFTYSWSCTTSQGDNQQPCKVALIANNVTGTIYVGVNASSLQSTSAVRAVVSFGNRITTSSAVMIQAVSLNAPMLTIPVAQADVTNINVDHNLMLPSTVLSPMTCNTKWTVSDSKLNLNNLVTTPYPKQVLANILTNVNLYLSPYALFGGASYVFTISCNTTSLSVTVTTNGPPSGGQLVITPSVGFAYNTTFTWSATGWQDANLPLVYIFNFQSPTTMAWMAIRGRSIANTATGLLPSGYGDGEQVTTQVTVEDSLGAGTNMDRSVRVRPPASTAGTMALLTQRFNISLDTDYLMNTISMASNLLAVVDCSGAPICGSLQRAQCLSTANTCGVCMEGFTSSAVGDSNVPCVSIQAANNYTAFIGRTCTSNSTCASWQYCSQSRCTDFNKKCGSPSCSDHGSCKFFSSSSGLGIDSCSVMSSACEAKCVCVDGFRGDDCSASNAQYQEKQDTQSLWINGLGAMLDSGKLDSSGLVQTANMLAVLSGTVEPVFDSSVEIVDITTGILGESKTMTVTSKNLGSTIQSIDAVLGAMVSSQNDQASNVTGGCFDAVFSFGDLVKKDVETSGQKITYIKDNFLLTSELLQGITDLEAFNYSATPPVPLVSKQQSVQLTVTPSSVDNVHLELVTTKQKVWKGNSSILSNDIVSVRANNVDFVDAILPVFSWPANSTASNYSIQCNAHVAAEGNFTCPSGYVVRFPCNGSAFIVEGPCPMQAPACQSLDMSDQSEHTDSLCHLVQGSLQGATCRCVLRSTARRRLTMGLDSSTSANLQSAVSVGVAFVFVGQNFAHTFKAAPALTSPEALAKVIVVIVLYGTIWGCGLVVIVYFHWVMNMTKELETKRKEKRRLSMVSVAADPEANEMEAKNKLIKYISSVFPTAFEKKSLLVTLRDELTQHHSYLNFLVHGRHKSPELNVIKMLTIQSFMLFLLALLYDLSYPDDDGSCPGYTTLDSCLDRKYAIDTTRSYCQWNSDLAQCSFADPQFSFKSALYFSIAVTICTGLITEPLDYLFSSLASPSENQQVLLKRRQQNIRRSQQIAPLEQQSPVARKRSVIAIAPVENERVEVTATLFTIAKPRYTMRAEDEAAEIIKQIQQQALPLVQRRASERMDQKRRMSVQLPPSPKSKKSRKTSAARTPSTVSSPNTVTLPITSMSNQDNAKLLLTELINDISLQRTMLQPEQRSVFDEKWCLDSTTGAFLSKDLYYYWKGRRTISVQHMVEEELLEVEKESDQVALRLSAATDRDVGLEILQQFVADLLGRDTPAARIFACKAEEDFERVVMVSMKSKVLIACFIVALNGFFIYFTMLKGLQKGLHWQTDFVKAWVAQMLLDMLIFETMEVLWIHCVMPFLVSKEVQRVYLVLQQSIQQLYDPSLAKGMACINAPEYFFVSHRLAETFPDLLESTIVRAYNTHLPGELGRVWQKRYKHGMDEAATDQQNASFTSCLASLPRAFVVSFLVQVVAYAPLYVQRMTIRFLEPLIVSGLTLGFYFLITHPLYLALFCIFVAIVLGLMMWDFYRMRRETKLGVIAPDVLPAVDVLPSLVEDSSKPVAAIRAQDVIKANPQKEADLVEQWPGEDEATHDAYFPPRAKTNTQAMVPFQQPIAEDLQSVDSDEGR